MLYEVITRQIADMGYAIDGENYVASVKAAREEEIDAILRRSAFPRERIRIVMTVGNPVDELLRLVMSESVDMVVITSYSIHYTKLYEAMAKISNPWTQLVMLCRIRSLLIV